MNHLRPHESRVSTCSRGTTKGTPMVQQRGGEVTILKTQKPLSIQQGVFGVMISRAVLDLHFTLQVPKRHMMLAHLSRFSWTILKALSQRLMTNSGSFSCSAAGSRTFCVTFERTMIRSRRHFLATRYGITLESLGNMNMNPCSTPYSSNLFSDMNARIRLLVSAQTD